MPSSGATQVQVSAVKQKLEKRGKKAGAKMAARTSLPCELCTHTHA